MNESVKQALEKDLTIDITTRGRKTGEPRRTEIWFHNLEGKIYITGTPGRRDWYANLLAHPDFTFHLKESIQAELSARARPIVEMAERRQVLSGIIKKLGRDDDLDARLEGSPLIEVELR